MQDMRNFYINGQWQAPHIANDLSVENPSNEEIIATISLGNQTDVNAAVSAARSAFKDYSVTSKETRIALLEKLLNIYTNRWNEMAQAISYEMGAPADLAKQAQTDTGRGHLDAAIKTLKTYEFESQKANATIIKEPIGVCGLITPWNWPINQIMCKVAPALATGCTIVLKPSEVAPMSAYLLAEMIDEAGFPPGVFNLVNGDGPGVGSAISNHADIDMISFTGSTRAGVQISQAAAHTVKRVALELGGKSPNIIFENSNLEKAVTSGVRNCMFNTGQSCNAPTRMLVPAKHYTTAIEIAAKAANSVNVDNSDKTGSHIGPLVSKTHFNKVQSLIQKGIDEGAQLVAGGLGKPDGLEVGHFCKPTVFSHVNNQMTIAREEVFGPVLVMIPYETEQEAVEIANDTPYGLAAYIQTDDPEQANRVSRQLRAGMICLNGAPHIYSSPFGGYKQSGNGREWDEFGFEDYLEIKSVSRPF